MPLAPKQQPPFYTPTNKTLTYTGSIYQTVAGGPITEIASKESTITGTWTRTGMGIYIFLTNITLPAPNDLTKVWINGFTSAEDGVRTNWSIFYNFSGMSFSGAYTIFPQDNGSQQLQFKVLTVQGALTPLELYDLIGTNKLYIPEIKYINI